MNHLTCVPVAVIAPPPPRLSRAPRNAALVFALAVAPLLSTLSFNAVAFCTQPTAKAATGSSALTATQNFGIYDWDESAQAWVLDQAGYAAFVESETLQAGDISIPASVFSGGGGGTGGGGGGGTHVNLQADEPTAVVDHSAAKAGTSSLCADDPPRMPATIVTGFRPTGGGGGIGNFLHRLVVFVFGGGRSGIGRPTPTFPSRNQQYDCGTDLDPRLANAASTRGLYMSLSGLGTTFTVVYHNGQRETFIVTEPFSEFSVVPTGECK